MENICTTCDLDPSSHSCDVFNTYNSLIIYTCPNKALLYNDAEGIVMHYDNILKNNTKDWEFICDFDGFSFKHTLAVPTAIGVVKLFSQKYYKNLIKVNIINSNRFLHICINIVWPFANDHMKSIIYIDNVKYDRV